MAIDRSLYYLYSKSFYDFFIETWSILNPNPLELNWHIQYICETLQDFYESSDQYLIINIPPRFLKTNIVSIAFPAWVWLRNPQKYFIHTSYSDSLVLKSHYLKRLLIKSQKYQSVCDYELQSGADSKGEYFNSKQGYSYAVTVGGALTGQGGDIILVDDPHSPLMARSDIKRQHALDWYSDTLQSRLNNPKTGKTILIMQRLHEDDLTGYILSHKNNIRHISLQLIAESDQKIVMPISKTVINLKRGDLLDKNRFNMDIVNDLKRNMGSYNFSGQYQQSPVPASGGTIKREWVKFYNPRIKKDFEFHIHSWDFAFKANDDNDFVAGQDWGKDNANIYLCDFIKERLTFNQSLQEMAKFTKKNSNYSEILIEDKANGSAIHDTIKEHIMGVIPIEPEGSKEARVHAVSPLWEAGNVYLPCDSDQQTIDRYNQSPTKENYTRLSISPEVEDFIKSMITFPKGKHDDDVDAMSQALFRIKSTSSFDNMVNSVYNIGRYRVQDYS